MIIGCYAYPGRGFYVTMISPSLHWCMEWHGCLACCTWFWPSCQLYIL